MIIVPILRYGLVTLSLLTYYTVAIPSLHTVNQFNLQGQTCPLQTLFHQECLPLCVKSIDTCPEGTVLSCPSGEQLCNDGNCHKNCKGVTNPCACSLGSFDYIPCGGKVYSNVEGLVPENRTSMIADACATSLKLKEEEYELWSETSTKPYVWLSCPVLPEPTFTFTEPMFLAFFIIVASQLGLFLTWHLFKKAVERSVPLSQEPSSKSATSVEFRYEGYRSNLFGTLLFYNTFVVTLAWFSLLAVLVADNYGAIGSEAFFIFLSSDLLSKIFVVVWHMATVWLVVLFLAQDRLRNYFRLRCTMKQAEVVQIEKYPDQVILSASFSPWLLRFKNFIKRCTVLLGVHLHVQTVSVHTLPSGLLYFEFQCVRYVKTASDAQFSPTSSTLPSTCSELLRMRTGLDLQTVRRYQDQHGPNQITVPVSSFFSALAQEFVTFPYLYQMMFLWVWFFFNYYQMGLVQLTVIIVSAILQVIIRIRSETQIQGLAAIAADYWVLRDGSWVSLPCAELVPGDVFQLERGNPVPCDAVLLSGEAIIDESMLTGEAMPVRKVPLRDDQSQYSSSSGSTHSLVSGTTILQVTEHVTDGSSTTNKVVGLATATGINTDKGALIQRILFPSQYSFVFTDHLRVVILILLSWGMVCFGLSMYFMGRGNVNSWFYGMFVISQILSPLLPSALVVGQSVAATRLSRRHQISCVDLPRIMVAGKVKTFCFDKTGTLTLPGLNFHGLQGTLHPDTDHPTKTIFDQMVRPQQLTEDLTRIQQFALATCHAVSDLNGSPIGNPVDIEQFQTSRWSFHSTFDDSQYEGGFLPPAGLFDSPSPVLVVKKNPFVHARSSMSVIIEDPSTQHWHIFVKGSFEKIKTIVGSDSIPFNFDHTTSELAREGCYVLGLAHRDLGVLAPAEREQVRQWDRDQVESQAQLLGLLIFRNQLKPDTTRAIAELHNGDTRTVMVTGDNVLTGVCIARACGMIASGTQVILGDLKSKDVESSLMWQDVDTDKEMTLFELEELLMTSPHPVELAVTGKAFETLISQGKLRDLAPAIKVYARMTPENKVACIECLMETSVVGMCGDGGNDCGALRAAHVGVALSDAEASIVSPFSSRHHSIQSCVSLLRYGRAALASSFACYKFLIIYGEVMAWLELTQFYFSVVVTQPIWITIDGFVTVLMMLSLALANPARTLAKSRPTAQLLGPQTLASAISQSLVNLGFLASAIAMLFHQSFYKCNEFDGEAVDSAKWWLLGDNYEAEIIGLVCLAQFINAAGVFNFGHVFRSSWWRNGPLAFLYFGMLAFVAFLTLADPNPLSCIFRINCGSSLAITDLPHYPTPAFAIDDYNNPIGHNVMPHYFRYQLLALILANCLVNLMVEYFLILPGALPALLRRFTLSRPTSSSPSPDSSTHLKEKKSPPL